MGKNKLSSKQRAKAAQRREEAKQEKEKYLVNHEDYEGQGVSEQVGTEKCPSDDMSESSNEESSVLSPSGLLLDGKSPSRTQAKSVEHTIEKAQPQAPPSPDANTKKPSSLQIALQSKKSGTFAKPPAPPPPPLNSPRRAGSSSSVKQRYQTALTSSSWQATSSDSSREMTGGTTTKARMAMLQKSLQAKVISEEDHPSDTDFDTASKDGSLKSLKSNRSRSSKMLPKELEVIETDFASTKERMQLYQSQYAKSERSVHVVPQAERAASANLVKSASTTLFDQGNKHAITTDETLHELAELRAKKLTKCIHTKFNTIAERNAATKAAEEAIFHQLKAKQDQQGEHREVSQKSKKIQPTNIENVLSVVDKLYFEKKRREENEKQRIREYKEKHLHTHNYDINSATNLISPTSERRTVIVPVQFRGAVSVSEHAIKRGAKGEVDKTAQHKESVPIRKLEIDTLAAVSQAAKEKEAQIDAELNAKRKGSFDQLSQASSHYSRRSRRSGLAAVNGPNEIPTPIRCESSLNTEDMQDNLFTSPENCLVPETSKHDKVDTELLQKSPSDNSTGFIDIVKDDSNKACIPNNLDTSDERITNAREPAMEVAEDCKVNQEIKESSDFVVNTHCENLPMELSIGQLQHNAPTIEMQTTTTISHQEEAEMSEKSFTVVDDDSDVDSAIVAEQPANSLVQINEETLIFKGEASLESAPVNGVTQSETLLESDPANLVSKDILRGQDLNGKDDSNSSNQALNQTPTTEDLVEAISVDEVKCDDEYVLAAENTCVKNAPELSVNSVEPDAPCETSAITISHEPSSSMPGETSAIIISVSDDVELKTVKNQNSVDTSPGDPVKATVTKYKAAVVTIADSPPKVRPEVPSGFRGIPEPVNAEIGYQYDATCKDFPIETVSARASEVIAQSRSVGSVEESTGVLQAPNDAEPMHDGSPKHRPDVPSGFKGMPEPVNARDGYKHDTTYKDVPSEPGRSKVTQTVQEQEAAIERAQEMARIMAQEVDWWANTSIGSGRTGQMLDVEFDDDVSALSFYTFRSTQDSQHHPMSPTASQNEKGDKDPTLFNVPGPTLTSSSEKPAAKKVINMDAPDQWFNYWSDEHQREYYFNPRINEVRWRVPLGQEHKLATTPVRGNFVCSPSELSEQGEENVQSLLSKSKRMDHGDNDVFTVPVADFTTSNNSVVSGEGNNLSRAFRTVKEERDSEDDDVVIVLTHEQSSRRGSKLIKRLQFLASLLLLLGITMGLAIFLNEMEVAPDWSKYDMDNRFIEPKRTKQAPFKGRLIKLRNAIFRGLEYEEGVINEDDSASKTNVLSTGQVKPTESVDHKPDGKSKADGMRDSKVKEAEKDSGVIVKKLIQKEKEKVASKTIILSVSEEADKKELINRPREKVKVVTSNIERRSFETHNTDQMDPNPNKQEPPRESSAETSSNGSVESAIVSFFNSITGDSDDNSATEHEPNAPFMAFWSEPSAKSGSERSGTLLELWSGTPDETTQQEMYLSPTGDSSLVAKKQSKGFWWRLNKKKFDVAPSLTGKTHEPVAESDAISLKEKRRPKHCFIPLAYLFSRECRRFAKLKPIANTAAPDFIFI